MKPYDIFFIRIALNKVDDNFFRPGTYLLDLDKENFQDITFETLQPLLSRSVEIRYSEILDRSVDLTYSEMSEKIDVLQNVLRTLLDRSGKCEKIDVLQNSTSSYHIIVRKPVSKADVLYELVKKMTLDCCGARN